MNGLKVEPGGYVPRSARLMQRLVGRVVQLVPVLRIDAVDEQVGVEARLADEGEHVAGGRIDRDQCAAAVAEGVVGDLLQSCVEVQHQVVAGHRRRARQRAHRASAGIDLDLLDAGGAVQVFFVALLESGLADVVACRGNWPGSPSASSCSTSRWLMRPMWPTTCENISPCGYWRNRRALIFDAGEAVAV